MSDNNEESLFPEEEKYTEFTEKDLTLGKDEKLLNISKCNEKSSKEKIKSFMTTNINPKLKNISKTNSEVIYDLETILSKIVDNKNSLSSTDEKTLEHLSSVVIKHSVLEDTIDEIIQENKDF